MFVWIVERKEDGDWKAYHGMYDSRKEARTERDWLKSGYEERKFRIRKYVREEE